MGERVHEQNVGAGLGNLTEQAARVEPAGLIELIVATECVEYIGSRGRAKKELTVN